MEDLLEGWVRSDMTMMGEVREPWEHTEGTKRGFWKMSYNLKPYIYSRGNQEKIWDKACQAERMLCGRPEYG